MARRAGIMQPNTPARVRMRVTEKNVKGSVGKTPTRRVPMTRVTPKAATSPKSKAPGGSPAVQEGRDGNATEEKENVKLEI